VLPDALWQMTVNTSAVYGIHPPRMSASAELDQTEDKFGQAPQC